MRDKIINYGILILCVVVASVTIVQTIERHTKSTTEPVKTAVPAAMPDNIIPEHRKLDEAYRATCNDTQRILRECDETLKKCVDMLEHRAVILPAEKGKP